jgi:hypothetical protein
LPAAESPPAKPADTVAMPAIVDSAVLNKLIAGAKVIAVTARTNIRDESNPLNQIVSEQLRDTFHQLDVTGRPANPSSPNRLDLTLITAKSGKLFNVELTAELKCNAPDGKSVTVWKEKRQIASYPSPGPPSEDVLDAMRVEVIKFFDEFADAVRAAREKVHPE